MLLLLLLGRFSRVRLCATPQTAAHRLPVPGILQARTLEWVAISFSNAWKWKVKVKSLSRVRLLATPWTAVHQAPPPMGFSRQECWSGVPLPSPRYYVMKFKKITEHWSSKLKSVSKGKKWCWQAEFRGCMIAWWIKWWKKYIKNSEFSEKWQSNEGERQSFQMRTRTRRENYSEKQN